MKTQQLLKGLEFSTMIGFGVAYWQYDLQVATIVLMALMTVFVGTAKVLNEPLTKLQLGTWVIVVVLGMATLFFRDDRFIKWKTTVINGTLAMVFLLSHVIGERTLAERLLAERSKAPRDMLRRVNLAAVLHLTMIASLNLLFAYRYETTIWVNFKIFGIFFLNFLFVVGVLAYLRPYLKDLMESLEKR